MKCRLMTFVIFSEAGATLDELLAYGQGLDQEDYKAELEVLQANSSSHLSSAKSFEELGL